MARGCIAPRDIKMNELNVTRIYNQVEKVKIENKGISTFEFVFFG